MSYIIRGVWYPPVSTYNTGKANKAEYSYYKKTECAKEIEECMKSLLNKEFYNCSLNKILHLYTFKTPSFTCAYKYSFCLRVLFDGFLTNFFVLS